MRRRALLAVVAVGLALASAGATAATPSPVAASHNDTVSAEFQPDTVAAGANTTLRVTNTSSDTVAIDSPDLSAERLHRVVEGEPSGDEVLANVSDGRVNVRFGECAPTGEYEFVVSEGTMTPDAHANLTVVAPADTEPAFRESVVGVSSGVTARIGIDAGCADRATLRVGSESAGFLATTTVALNRSDAVVRLDTNGTDAADALFASGPNTTLRNATLARAAAPPLPPGEYDLTLTANGTETDVAVLNVSEVPDEEGAATPTDGTAVPTVFESPTPTPTTPTAGPEPPTASPTPTDGDDGTPPVTSSDGQPGFGVGVAVISIIAILYVRSAE